MNIRDIIECGVENIAAKTPPGWENSVKRMKDHPEISNPYALSWYMKDKGDKPHPKKKSVKAGGQGSGRRPGGNYLPKHFMGQTNPKALQNMHDQLTSQGFKHQFSTKTRGYNTMVHSYTKKSGATKQTKVIKEQATGNHSIEDRPSV